MPRLLLGHGPRVHPQQTTRLQWQTQGAPMGGAVKRIVFDGKAFTMMSGTDIARSFG